MPVTVMIPTPLRPLAGGAHQLPASGGDLSAVLEDLCAGHGQLKERLLAEDGRLQPFVHLFVNGRDVQAGQGLATPVPDGAQVLIIQAISGG